MDPGLGPRSRSDDPRIEEVLFFISDEKYTRVQTRSRKR